MTAYWDFRRLLDVNPDDPGFTCVGTTKKGLRCRQFFFSGSDLYRAARILDTMDRQQTSSDVCILLKELAGLTLCPRWHRKPGYSQVDEMSYKWQVTIEEYMAHRMQEKLRQIMRGKKQREAAARARARAEDAVTEYITPHASPVLAPVGSESTYFAVQPLPTGQPSFSQHTAQVHGLPTPETTPERELPQPVQDISPSKMSGTTANRRHNLTSANDSFKTSNPNGTRMFGQPKATKDLSNLGSTSDSTKPMTSLPGDNTKASLNTSFKFGSNKENPQIPFSFGKNLSVLQTFNAQVQEQWELNPSPNSQFENVVEPLFSSAGGKERVQKTIATNSIPEHRKEVRATNTEIEPLVTNATNPEDIPQVSSVSPSKNAEKEKKQMQICEASGPIVLEPTQELTPEQQESIRSTPQEVETTVTKSQASETLEVLLPTAPSNSISASPQSTTQEVQSPAPRLPITKKDSFGYADVTPPSKYKISLPAHYPQPALSSLSPQTSLHNPNGLFGDFIVETTFKFSTSRLVTRKPLPISKDAIIRIEERPEICLRCGMRDRVCGCDGGKDEDMERRAGCLSLGFDELKKSLRMKVVGVSVCCNRRCMQGISSPSVPISDPAPRRPESQVPVRVQPHISRPREVVDDPFISQPDSIPERPNLFSPVPQSNSSQIHVVSREMRSPVLQRTPQATFELIASMPIPPSTTPSSSEPAMQQISSHNDTRTGRHESTFIESPIIPVIESWGDYSSDYPSPSSIGDVETTFNDQAIITTQNFSPTQQGRSLSRDHRGSNNTIRTPSRTPNLAMEFETQSNFAAGPVALGLPVEPNTPPPEEHSPVEEHHTSPISNFEIGTNQDDLVQPFTFELPLSPIIPLQLPDRRPSVWNEHDEETLPVTVPDEAEAQGNQSIREEVSPSVSISTEELIRSITPPPSLYNSTSSRPISQQLLTPGGTPHSTYEIYGSIQVITPTSTLRKVYLPARQQYGLMTPPETPEAMTRGLNSSYPVIDSEPMGKYRGMARPKTRGERVMRKPLPISKDVVVRVEEDLNTQQLPPVEVHVDVSKDAKKKVKRKGREDKGEG
ncbi:hypothetical protein B7494_g2349 [Chlorociboria aeruginascens]|nr:hypothetical protein B7494_g2349 [Chlorociboria aeruginascens]